MIILPPTYGMYQVSADLNDIPLTKIPLTSDFQIDTEATLAAVNPQTKIIWLCSPNNPSGNLLREADILAILNGFSGLVVIDEAYADYSDAPSWVARLDEFPNLVVLQTFSKAWGMAALRLGMAFASEDLIRILSKVKAPYNINGLTQQILLSALEHSAYVKEVVNQTRVLRHALAQQLAELPQVVKVYPSDANFLLVKFEDSAAVFQHLMAQGVIVRDRSKVLLCENCLRITVGTATENALLLQHLTT
jgi:histidinol-phosphate aminotransferase